MAQFGALTEGFRELNRMLTDRQAFNAQHEANQAKSERNSSILASQLEDRAFGRAMQEKNMLIGMERDEHQKQKDAKQFAAMTSQFQQEMDLKKDKVNIDESRLNLDTKLNDINIQYKREQKNKLVQDQQPYFEDNEKKPLLSVLEGTGFHKASPEVQQEIIAKFPGATGVKYDPDGKAIDVVNDDGQPFQASNRDARRVQPLIKNILKDVEINTPKESLARVAEINARLKELAPVQKMESTSMIKDVRFKPQAASVKQEINSLKKELAEVEPLTGVAGEIKDIEEKIERTRSALAQQVRIGDPEADVTKAELDVLLKQEEVAKGSGKSGPLVHKVVHQLDPNGNIIDTEMVSLPAAAFRAGAGPDAGGNDRFKGWVFAEEQNMKTNEDKERQKVFTAAAKRLYGPPEGVPGFVNPANQLLHVGLTSVMNKMSRSKAFKGLTSDEIATQAPNMQAQMIGMYFKDMGTITLALDKGIIDKAEYDKRIKDLEKETVTDLGSVPTSEMLDRMVKIGRLKESDVVPPGVDPDDESTWDNVTAFFGGGS